MTSEQEQPAYATAAAVAGMAREVEALGRRLDQLSALPALVDELTRLVTQLAETTAAATGARTSSGPAPSWLDLSARVRAAHRLLGELVDWMRGVYLRYADGAASLPDCWLWHPDVIEELLWLREAWLAAYRDDDASISAAGDWHDRYRPGVVRRIAATAGRCSLENHQPRPDRPLPAAPAVPAADAVELIGTWWASERHKPPPAPTNEQLASVADRHRSGARR